MTYHDTTVIIPYRETPCGHRQRNADYVEAYLTSILPGAEIIRADDNDPVTFNRGRAINVGVVQTTRPLLIFADGDIWLPKQAYRDAVERIRRNVVQSYVIPFDKIIWGNQSWTDRVLAGLEPITRRPKLGEIILEWGSKSVGITNVVTRENFYKFGGFDPRYRVWSPEDTSWDVMATTLGGPSTRLHYEGRHLYHPSDPGKENVELLSRGTALWERYGAIRGNKPACLAMREEITTAHHLPSSWYGGGRGEVDLMPYMKEVGSE